VKFTKQVSLFPSVFSSQILQEQGALLEGLKRCESYMDRYCSDEALDFILQVWHTTRISL
jgi:hypothetical protein